MGSKIRSNGGLTGAYVLAAGLVLCGTVLSNHAYDRSLTVRHLIWCALTALLLAIVVFRKDFRAAKSPAVLLFAGFSLFTAVSGLHAINFGEWFYELLRAGMMTVFLFCAITLVDRRITAGAMTMLAAVLGVWGLYQLATHTSPMMPGLMGNRNPWSAAFMLLVPFCLMTRWWPVVLLPAANVVWLFARSSLLALGAMSMAHKRLRYIALGVVVVLWITNYRNVTNTESLGERGQQWRATADMVTDNPLGVGAGNWKLRIPQYSRYFTQANAFETHLYTRPHNDFIWILAETGLAGLGFYAGAIGYALWCAWRKGDKAVLAGLIGYCVFASFSFPLERAFHSMILLTLIALAVKTTGGADLRHKRLTWPARAAVGLVFLALGCSLVDFNARHTANCQAKALRLSKDGAEARAILEHISPLAQLDNTSSPLHLFRSIAAAQAGDAEAAEADMWTACRVNPNHAASLIAYATILHNTGRHFEAVNYRDRASAIAPNIEHILKGKGGLSGS